MALTKDEVTVLRFARERIASGSYSYGYVCNHINSVVVENPQLKTSGICLLRYINSALKGHGTLEGWQRANGRRSVSKGHIEDRLQWIDWMMGLQ